MFLWFFPKYSSLSTLGRLENLRELSIRQHFVLFKLLFSLQNVPLKEILQLFKRCDTYLQLSLRFTKNLLSLILNLSQFIQCLLCVLSISSSINRLPPVLIAIALFFPSSSASLVLISRNLGFSFVYNLLLIFFRIWIQILATNFHPKIFLCLHK